MMDTVDERLRTHDHLVILARTLYLASPRRPDIAHASVRLWFFSSSVLYNCTHPSVDPSHHIHNDAGGALCMRSSHSYGPLQYTEHPENRGVRSEVATY
jgi:hypothetical protein